MAKTPVTPETTLRLERVLAAPPTAVFDAWTSAEALTQWFAPTNVVRVPELDARTGGRYRIEMENATGARYIITGVYEDVSRPTRLVFTWTWEVKPESNENGDTRVTIELRPDGAGTRLVLTHDRLTTIESREQHQKGWIGCLDSLDRHVTR